MSNDYHCCNDCGKLEAIWRITFGCYLCAECYAYAVEEEDMLRKQDEEND